jgi:cysteinyl-tRNA synthetase
MARALLDPEGEGFDIHGGGADLIFPHHENEIAQSEPLMTQPPMANFWVHGGLLLFDNKKMSKSLGNYEPLSDLLERHDPQAIRLSMLQTSYAKVKNFTDESVAGAAVALRQLKKAYRSLHALSTPVETGLAETGYVVRVETELDADMNTAAALAVMLEFAGKSGEVAARAGAGETLYEFSYLLTMLGIEPRAEWLDEPKLSLSEDFLERLGAALNERFDGATPEVAIERVIAMRHEARARKDWAASDRLRDALLDCGVALKDSKEGSSWSVAGD